MALCLASRGLLFIHEQEALRREEVILVYHLFLWLAITHNLSLPLTLQREQIYLNT